MLVEPRSDTDEGSNSGRSETTKAEKTADSQGEPDSDGLRELVRRGCVICWVVALFSLLVSVSLFVPEG